MEQLRSPQAASKKEACMHKLDFLEGAVARRISKGQTKGLNASS
jgi:hypothetical protein